MLVCWCVGVLVCLCVCVFVVCVCGGRRGGEGGEGALAVEVAGRFPLVRQAQFLRGLVSAKIHGVPELLKRKAAASWMR